MTNGVDLKLMNEVEIPLDNLGNSWVKQTLHEGHTLAHQVLESLDIDAGKVVTFLPPEADIESAKSHFEWSVMPIAPKEEWVWLEKTPDGKQPYMTPVHTVDARQIEIVQEFLQADPDHVLICEDMILEPTYPAFRKSKNTLWTYGEEVYHVIFSVGRPKVEKIRRVMGQASSWLFIGMMSSFPSSGRSGALRKEITVLELKTIAQNTQKLIIGAYDHDGYIIWSKPV